MSIDHAPSVLLLHPRDQAFHHRNIAPEDADQHLVFRIGANDAVGCGQFNRDARQLGGVGDQRIERQVDPRRDDTALVGTVVIDGI